VSIVSEGEIDKQVLMALGRIEGRMEEQSRASVELRQALQRVEDTMLKTFKEHDARLRELEVNVASDAGRRGAVSGGAVAGVALALVEAARHLWK
jgi:hypothetical protein